MKNWDLIRAFLALHRAGTFEGAAHLIGVDHSTLRRRIQILEEKVGDALFTRNDGQYSVMPAMEPLLDAAIRMEASSRLFFEGGVNGAVGAVRVTMMDTFAQFLAPDLAAFQRLYPDIRLEVSTEHYFVDLEREMVDVAIRLARPTRGSSRLKKLADIHYGVYAAPDYLERHGEGRPEGHDLLTLSVHFTYRYHEFLEQEADWMRHYLPPGRVVCGTDSYVLLRRYCEDGMGMALLPEILGEESDKLVRLAGEQTAQCTLWLVVNSDTWSSQRVRVFADFISESFRRRLPPR